MTTTDVKTLGNEAIRNLEAFQKTGLVGFWQKGIDRVKALGINPGECDAEHLINHLYLNGYGA